MIIGPVVSFFWVLGASLELELDGVCKVLGLKEGLRLVHGYLLCHLWFQAFEVRMNTVCLMHMGQLEHELSKLSVIQEDGCFLLKLVQSVVSNFSSIDKFKCVL